MALVVVCGQPCSGKSTAAACLYEALQAVVPKPSARIIDESSLHIGRNQIYANEINLSSTPIAEAVSCVTLKANSKSRDVKILQPTIATQNARISEANSLYEMDQATQRQIGLPELRSLRRTFIKLTGQSSLSGPPPPSDADSAKRMFVDYLNRQIGIV